MMYNVINAFVSSQQTKPKRNTENKSDGNLYGLFRLGKAHIVQQLVYLCFLSGKSTCLPVPMVQQDTAEYPYTVHTLHSYRLLVYSSSVFSFSTAFFTSLATSVFFSDLICSWYVFCPFYLYFSFVRQLRSEWDDTKCLKTKCMHSPNYIRATKHLATIQQNYQKMQQNRII